MRRRTARQRAASRRNLVKARARLRRRKTVLAVGITAAVVGRHIVTGSKIGVNSRPRKSTLRVYNGPHQPTTPHSYSKRPRFTYHTDTYGAGRKGHFVGAEAFGRRTSAYYVHSKRLRGR